MISTVTVKMDKANIWWKMNELVYIFHKAKV